MKRRAIKFVPRWPGPIQGNAVNQIRQWFPALCAEHEFDDLLQEAYIVFLRVKRRYTKVDNPRWFMALFQIALRNKLQNMAAKSGRMFSIEVVNAPEPATDGDEAFNLQVLRELPERARALIHVMLEGTEAEGRRAFRALMDMAPSFA